MGARIIKENIVDISNLSEDIYRLRVKSDYLANNAKCGQFVNVKCSEGLDAYLRRPISICDTNKDEGTTDIIFQVKGKGTKLLSELSAGNEIDILGPLGNGFTLKPAKRAIAVGGGIGIFPLLKLIKDLKGMCEDRTAILGFRNKSYVVLEDEFTEAADLLKISTDDGSYGIKGFTTTLLEEEILKNKPDIIYSCGPIPMLKGIAKLAEKYDIECEISMEERMGCGVGACLVCACKTKTPEVEGWQYSRVCMDGPIFNSREVIFDG